MGIKPPSVDQSIIVALIEEIREFRKDVNERTDRISTKMEENQKENLDEFKEMRKELAEVQTRLSEGSERMRNLRKDVESAKNTCALHSQSALIRKQQQGETDRASHTKLKWWQLVAITAVITYAAPIAWNKCIAVLNSMFNPPAQQATKP